jgi:hypothetical protein
MFLYRKILLGGFVRNIELAQLLCRNYGVSFPLFRPTRRRALIVMFESDSATVVDLIVKGCLSNQCSPIFTHINRLKMQE